MFLKDFVPPPGLSDLVRILRIVHFDTDYSQKAFFKPYPPRPRFDKAYRMKNRYPHIDWLSIAIACGYHDYQHLVRDYKDFTSLRPTAFYALEERGPERIFGLSDYYQDCIQ